MYLEEAFKIVIELAEAKNSEHEGIPKQKELEAIEMIKEILSPVINKRG